MRKDWFTIIIANYNGEEYLPVCLKSVFSSTYKKFLVILADDCSTDQSLDIVKKFQKSHKNLFLLKSSKNIGPSGQRAKALKRVKTEFVYFLDNDTKVDRNFLNEIYEIYQKSPKIGGVQSLLVDFDNKHTIQNAGLKLIPYTGWAIGILQNRPIANAPKEPLPVLGLSAALSVKKEVIDAGINFDPDFVHYSEDLDFSWRTWVAGYKILIAPKSIVYHKVKKINERKNVGANNKIVYYHLSKNSLASLTKNYELVNLALYLPLCLIILVSRAILVLIVRRDTSAMSGTVKAIVWYLYNLKNIIRKRNLVQSKRRLSDSEILNNISVKQGPINVYKKYFSQTKLLPI